MTIKMKKSCWNEGERASCPFPSTILGQTTPSALSPISRPQKTMAPIIIFVEERPLILFNNLSAFGQCKDYGFSGLFVIFVNLEQF